MEILLRDLRYALRMLRRSPGFTAAAVVCLALAIGANTAVFSLLNAVLLRSLPYRDAERIVMVWNQFLQDRQPQVELSASEFLDLREQARAYSDLAATRPGLFSLTGEGDPELLVGVRVSANLFRLLGVEAAAGRTFQPDEDEPGRDNNVVILSHGLFERRFGSDPGVVGRKIVINGSPFTVVGVTPRDFYFRRKPRDLWMPLVLDRGKLGARDDRPFEVYGRLRPGTTPAQAQQELAGIAHRFAQDHPEAYPRQSGYGMVAVSYREQIVGAIRPVLLVLSAAVGLVLLIACANISNLLLARASTRDREIALRAALGAGRGGLVRQFLTESLVLAAAGGALGLLLTHWSIQAVAHMDLSKIPRIDEVSIDARVLAFTVLVSLAAGVLFGLVPALQISRSNFVDALKEGSKGSAGGARSFARQLLVVVEIAVALVVLLGAGLMIESYRRLQRVDPGYKTGNVLTLEVFLPIKRYAAAHQWTHFFDELLERLQALPGVAGAASTSAVPLGVVTRSGEIGIEGQQPPPGQLGPTVEWRQVSTGYFRTLGIPLRRGRDFAARDDEGAEPVVVVDQRSADRFWPNQDPIGKRLKLVGQNAPGAWRTVVGVAGNVRHEGLESEPREHLYVPYRQYSQPFMYLLLHTTGDAAAMAAPARQAVLAIDKNQAVFRVETMAEKLIRTMAWRRFYTLLLTAFAIVALVLAVVGVYSVMAYSVTQRTREIGIRMALGSERGAVVGMVVRQAARLSAIGVAAGLGIALALLRIASGLLYGVSATDLKTFVGGALLLTLCALVASYLPARRASRIDPVIALRAE